MDGDTTNVSLRSVEGPGEGKGEQNKGTTSATGSKQADC